jgi:hypothetical protein
VELFDGGVLGYTDVANFRRAFKRWQSLPPAQYRALVVSKPRAYKDGPTRMTPAKFRKLALSLGEVEEVPHMERAAFRTKRKIFATLGDDKRVNLMVQPEERREALIEQFPETFFSLGGWSRLGYIAVDLKTVDEELLTELLRDAWLDALPKPKLNRRTTRPKRRTS